MSSGDDWELCQKAAEQEIERGVEMWDVEQSGLAIRLADAERELRELRTQLNTPHTTDFLEAVRVEAAHQRERWGVDHDAGKSDPDWFWLIGYLAGKALRPDNTPEKRLHHIITTAAVCLNWHAHATGVDTRMRPGIEPPGVLVGQEAP